MNRVVGLDNPQYFCYFNAIVQVLLSISDFCCYYYNKEYLKVTYPTHYQQKAYCQAFAKLIKEIWTLEEEYDYLKPAFFHKLLNKKFS